MTVEISSRIKAVVAAKYERGLTTKELIAAIRVEWKQEMAVDLIQAARRAGCSICSEPYQAGLIDLHHVDPVQKAFGLAMAERHTLAEVQAELAKCVPLCPTCHRKITLGLSFD